MTNKKVAITGATGFLGQHVVKAVIDAGHTPVAVVRDLRRASTIFPKNILLRKADILREEELVSAFDGCDVAIHLAGMVSVNKCDYDAMNTINIDGARNFLCAARRADIKRVIFTSTTSAVGALRVDDPVHAIDENALFNLGCEDIGYISSKRAAHLLALNAQDDGLPVVILSPSFVLGPNDINKNTSALIGAIAHRALPSFPGGGINPIDVRDVARSFIQTFDHPDPAPHYILASSENIIFKDFVKLVAKCAAVSPPLLSLPELLVTNVAKLIEKIFPQGELTEDGANLGRFFWYFDASLARGDLSLKCRPLEDTINATLAWLKNHEMENQ